MIVINHTYLSQDMYPTEVTAGGRGAQYACHTLWNIGKRQKKEGTELTGFDFMIRPVFSRYIREKSEFPITVTYDDGIEKYSGLFDLAFDLGIIKSEKQGWYIIDNSGKGFRRSDVEEDIVYMEALSKNKEFNKALEEKFKIN
jgi:hypothetical protein